jgi:hypothetical protein
LDAGSQYFAVEVEQKPSGLAQDTQIREYLRPVNSYESLDTVYLDDHLVFDNEIRPVFANDMPL